MQKQYRVEFFNRQFEYVTHASGEKPNLQFDYLTLENVSIVLPQTEAQLEALFAQVVDNENQAIYQGIVKDCKNAQGCTTVQIAPLLSLLDVTVPYNRQMLQTGAIETFIGTVILDTYKQNADALQNIAGVKFTATSSTQTYLNIKSNVHELWDICTRALTEYGVAINAKMNVQAKEIHFTIGKTEGTITVETNLPNCLERNIVIGSNAGSLNKAVYINKENETIQAILYRHPDGSIDTKNKNRITPVIFKTEYVETSEDFAEEAGARAIQDLTPQKFNNLIELTYHADDRLLYPAMLPMGQHADIRTKTEQYTSILTGFLFSGNAYTLIFGVVRKDLNKILIVERRKADANKN